MKIDIHTHTKKVKAGDANTRNVDAFKFAETIKNTDVKILAITNHNHFDIKQYEEFKNGVIENCQIWPGIELDILEKGRRSHLIVICNPKNVRKFNIQVTSILNNQNPDTFTISISDAIDKFDHLDCLYVAHYLTKKPNLGDEEIETLESKISNPKRILKEATNSISAGIYISHGHNSIYGSDIQDWNDYISISKDLPDLRLPVESFEQFCLLLNKDEATINTLLNKKVKENIQLVPFNNTAEIIRLDIYNDINIIFGSKGTGKTEILKSLSKYFNEKGHKTTVYQSNELHLKDCFDLKGSLLNINLTDLGIDECKEEIQILKDATEVEVTSLEKFRLHFSEKETNKISQKLKIKSITKIDERLPKRKLKEISDAVEKFKEFQEYNDKNSVLAEYIDADTLKKLASLISEILTSLTAAIGVKFFESKSVRLLNQIITVFNKEISKKTGQPEKPTKTGFSDYASNRIKIEIAVKKILNNTGKSIDPVEEYVGSLNEKGELFCRTNIVFQNGDFSDSNYSPIKKVTKTVQKDFVKKIVSISKYIHSTQLFEKIAALNQIENVHTISSVHCLLQFYKHFCLDGDIYQPSNGESSMILLFKELKEEKDVYLIDEPEKSLGNDYISDIIVPLLKEKAMLGKKVIIATHDANIAVRTLPYNSIYRLFENNQGYTMTGNPFSNSLKCIYNSKPELNWKEVSMKTLEGGKDAFGERGKIYGN
jgi:predicted ATPase